MRKRLPTLLPTKWSIRSSTGVLTVESSADWLVYVSHTESEINYGVTVWENSEESRSAVLTLKYPGAEDVQVTVVQLQ